MNPLDAVVVVRSSESIDVEWHVKFERALFAPVEIKTLIFAAAMREVAPLALRLRRTAFHNVMTPDRLRSTFVANR
jgi:hypothetical protein